MRNIFSEHKKAIIIGVVSLFIIVAVIIASIHFLAPDFHVKHFDKLIEVNYGEEFDMAAGEVCYGNEINCEKVIIKRNGDVDTSTLATYKISYTYTYKNKVKELKQVVSVVDKTVPELTIEASSLKVCPNGNTNNLEYKAIDNLDGDISDKVTTELKDNILYVSVKDSSGNEAKEEIKVTVEDTEKPKITLNGKAKINIQVGSKYNDEGAKVTDNCDSEIVLKTDNKVKTDKAGTYKVVYSATDSTGNKSIVERTVVVANATPRNPGGGKLNNDKPTGRGIVYLTFDDGPSEYTSKLLDILKKYDVKVTFFVTGYGSDAIIKREFNEGHTVALHSMSHDYAKIYRNEKAYFDDLNLVKARVERITGTAPTIIRFPGGSSNTVSRRYDGGTHIMSLLTRRVEEEGYHYFDWNVASGDAGETTSTEVVYKNVTNGMRTHDVSVILQHDTKNFSINAVERIIQFGLENGYTFKALDENSFGAHHGVNN